MRSTGVLRHDWLQAVARSQYDASVARNGGMAGGLAEIDLGSPLAIIGWTMLGVTIVGGSLFLLFKGWRKASGSRGRLYGLRGRR